MINIRHVLVAKYCIKTDIPNKFIKQMCTLPTNKANGNRAYFMCFKENMHILVLVSYNSESNSVTYMF
jgi:hypothetical protein